MTIEALSLTLCLASGIFGRPAWTPEKCQERAAQIIEIAERDGLDPMLFVAINIQECDMRENVEARFYSPTDGKKKRVELGTDACPMGIRLRWSRGKRPDKLPDALALYELAGRKMARWRRWCEKHHKGKVFGPHHHFVAHWNEGDRTYAAQVLAFRAVLMGRSPTFFESDLTSRSKEIVRRLQQAQRSRRS